MNVLDTSKNITRKSCISNAVSLNTRPFRSRRESKHDKVEIGQNNILDELFESSFPPVRSFDGEKRSYESRYPNSKRSLLPFELTPRVLCCIDNIKMGVKTLSIPYICFNQNNELPISLFSFIYKGAIVGSIFGGINGTYHAIKYRNYMSIPVFAVSQHNMRINLCEYICSSDWWGN
ncbi:hypothetical protein OIY81_64 [Cryptosporidium canis]|nr:hypothetical protein OIY81_64 [Cryptosporidium canis]